MSEDAHEKTVEASVPGGIDALKGQPDLVLIGKNGEMAIVEVKVGSQTTTKYELPNTRLNVVFTAQGVEKGATSIVVASAKSDHDVRHHKVGKLAEKIFHRSDR